MSKLKVGDRVRVLPSYRSPEYVGVVGVIYSVSDGMGLLNYSAGGQVNFFVGTKLGFPLKNLELVEETEELTPKEMADECRKSHSRFQELKGRLSEMGYAASYVSTVGGGEWEFTKTTVEKL